MIYRQIAPEKAQLSFAARRLLIEDFLQDFYADSLRAFRRENQVADNYTPRTRIELAEYMAFTEQYAKRRVMTGYGAVQLLVLRAKSFAKRQPTDTVMDIEQVTEFAKGEEAQMQNRSPMMQQVRERLVLKQKTLMMQFCAIALWVSWYNTWRIRVTKTVQIT
jgi:hypothetical protein